MTNNPMSYTVPESQILKLNHHQNNSRKNPDIKNQLQQTRGYYLLLDSCTD